MGRHAVCILHVEKLGRAVRFHETGSVEIKGSRRLMVVAKVCVRCVHVRSLIASAAAFVVQRMWLDVYKWLLSELGKANVTAAHSSCTQVHGVNGTKPFSPSRTPVAGAVPSPIVSSHVAKDGSLRCRWHVRRWNVENSRQWMDFCTLMATTSARTPRGTTGGICRKSP